MASMSRKYERNSTATIFNDDWEFRSSKDQDWTIVALPHDAMLGERRSADAPSTTHGAFFHGGKYHYRKLWHAPESLRGKKIALIFDGVYRHSRILVNNKHVGGCISGYTQFEVSIEFALKFGRMNTIEVQVDNSQQPSARWYTGSGIYRTVRLLVRNHDLLRNDGIRLTTKVHSSIVRVSCSILLHNPGATEVTAKLQLSKHGQETSVWESTTTGAELHADMEIKNALLWSADTPHLYDCVVEISGDIYRFQYGLRTVEWGPKDGLLINGQTVKLRGACIHADNGILGACSFKAAEVRRMKLLKASGFNAIRMSHHPASSALLEACDEVGMFVMDEYSDYWYLSKAEHDEAGEFHDTWKSDIKSMVARARNHASVIMYSLGNEVTEPKTAYGHTIMKKLLDYQRFLDPTRPNTVAINLLLATMLFSGKPPGDPDTPPPPAGAMTAMFGSSLVNVLFSLFMGLMEYVPRLSHCDNVTKDLFSNMDIAGYNYGSCRYLKDATLHPDRIMLGTETCPPDIAKNWDLVERIPNLIGDFMWVGWDYIGETGVGAFDYGAPVYSPGTLYKPYPALLGSAGVLDITGMPNASAFVARAAWKQVRSPIIAVRPLDVSSLRYRTTAWRRSDAISGWAWRGCEGQMAYVEVISTEEEIELFLNSRSLGRVKSSLHTNYTAKFKTRYEPGQLVAVGYTGGKECSRSSVNSAGDASISIINEGPDHLSADGQDIAFLRLELSDADGVVEMNDDDELEVVVQGPATLAGLGTARSQTTESFVDNVHRTYRGRALAAVRAGMSAGNVVFTVNSKRHGTASVTIVQKL